MFTGFLRFRNSHYLWQIYMEVLNKIAQLKAELDSLRPLDKDREAAIMQKLRLDWNYHSNHLEGNSLTFGETKALILFGITAAGKPLKDHFEMTGHDEAVKWVEDVVKIGRPMTEMFIRELHKLILKEPYEMPTITPEGIPAKRIINVGVYKTTPNHVLTPTGEIFRFATPEETPAMMHDLIEWYRQKESDPETHPLLMAAEFHYKFIRIHPFDDGNGRSARILMNFILMKHGYPPVVVKTEDKANYIAALQLSDAGIITPFIEYIGENLAYSLEIMLRGARGENIDEPDDVDKEIALIERKIKNLSTPEDISFEERKVRLFDSCISKLLREFIKQNQKFKHFYVDVDWRPKGGSFDTNPLVYKRINERIIKEIRFNYFEKKSTRTIQFRMTFYNFNNPVVQKFSYTSIISIFFEDSQWTISSSKKNLSFTLAYGEELEAAQINDIVRAETKAHTDYINQQIELAQKKSEP